MLKFNRLSRKSKQEALKQKCIDAFKAKNPQKYKKIKDLNARVTEEKRYSFHMGSYRDGSEDSRQDNIQQQGRIDKLRATLREEVKSAFFGHVVRDVCRATGDEDEAAALIFNSVDPSRLGMSGFVTIVSAEDIGFDSIPIDELVYYRDARTWNGVWSRT